MWARPTGQLRLVIGTSAACNRVVIDRLPLRLPTLGLNVDDAGCEVDDLAFCAAVQVRVGADEDWSGLVDRAVAAGWVGIEALGGVLGRVGDVTRDNASAYGQAVADTVAAVRTWDRRTDAQRTFPLTECGFRPGSSRFQEMLDDGSPRFEVLDVAFLLSQGDLTRPVWEPVLVAALGIEPGGRAPLARVRDVARRLVPPPGR